jgi:hypothetical protein
MTNITAGPWSGRYYDGEVWTLTLDELTALLKAVPDKSAMCDALGVDRLSHRKANHALQLLRKARLIEYVSGWSRTLMGDAEVSR